MRGQLVPFLTALYVAAWDRTRELQFSGANTLPIYIVYLYARMVQKVCHWLDISKTKSDINPKIKPFKKAVICHITFLTFVLYLHK